MSCLQTCSSQTQKKKEKKKELIFRLHKCSVLMEMDKVWGCHWFGFYPGFCVPALNVTHHFSAAPHALHHQSQLRFCTSLWPRAMYGAAWNLCWGAGTGGKRFPATKGWAFCAPGNWGVPGWCKGDKEKWFGHLAEKFRCTFWLKKGARLWAEEDSCCVPAFILVSGTHCSPWNGKNNSLHRPFI